MTGPVRLRHDLHVSATPERVWSLTTELEAWPTLTPTMRSVTRLDSGPLAVGSTARVLQPRMRPATWRVTALEPPSRFAWRTALPGVAMTAEHRLATEGDGCRNTLLLEVAGPAAALLGTVARPVLRSALATENDGFRRAAEGLVRPRFVDEHRFRVAGPPGAAWPALRAYAERLASGSHSRLPARLLGTEPASGFDVVEEVDGRRVGLRGRHRFSRYLLDLRVDPVGPTESEVSAVTYADVPGVRGLAYRAVVVGTRAHVVAVRRMLAAMTEDL